LRLRRVFLALRDLLRLVLRRLPPFKVLRAVRPLRAIIQSGEKKTYATHIVFAKYLLKLNI